jgi:Restriction endonuclease NaeI
MDDGELAQVAAELRKMDPNGLKTARVLRETLDQLYDGQRTGRFRWNQLHKTEKTHCGTLVEINLQRHFLFADGDLLDYKIAGIEVDCKYSQTIGAWMIPPEAIDKLCLLVSADDATGLWYMGLVRATRDKLRVGTNRDLKSSLSAGGQSQIHWLFHGAELPPNVLLRMDPKVVDGILSHKSGVKRLNELFRQALGKRVTRGVIATVARQDDYMKRIRENGGARSELRPEGIVILGQFKSHAQIAEDLGVDIPQAGESVAVRLASAETFGEGVVMLEGKLWKVAEMSDPVVQAPRLPSAKN